MASCLFPSWSSVNILSCGDKLFHIEMRSSRSNLYSLKCEAYAVIASERRLQLLDGYVENSEQMTYLTRATILDHGLLSIAQSQLEMPFILIGKRYENSESLLKLMLIAVVPTARGTVRMSYAGHPIKLRFTSAAEEFGARLADGPVIYWQNNRVFYVNFLKTTTGKFVTLKATVSDSNFTKILAVNSHYVEPSSESGPVGHMTVVVHTPTTAHLVQLLLKPLQDCISVLSSRTFPAAFHGYVGRASAVAIVDGADQAQPVHGDTSCRILCLAASGEFVVFDSRTKATLTCPTVIPLTSVNNTRLLCHRNGAGGDRNYAIVQLLNSNKAFVLSLSRLKVVRSYENVNVFSGDYLHCGSPVLVLITRTSGSRISDCAIEVDDLVHQCRISTARCNEENGDGESNSFATAKQALKARLVAGREAVSKSKSHIEHLSRALQEICGTLCKLAVGQPHLDEQPHLLQLLNVDSDAKDTIQSGRQIARPEAYCSTPLCVGPPWQRVCNGRWIIGFEAINHSNSIIQDFHLVLTSDQEELEQRTGVFKPNMYTSAIGEKPGGRTNEPPTKRSKADKGPESAVAPSEHVILVCTLDVGILKHRTELAIRATLTFKHEVSGKTVNGSISCPSTNLRLDQLLNGELHVDFSANKGVSDLLKDLAACDVSTEAIPVTILAKHTKLDSLMQILQDRTELALVQALHILYQRETAKDILHGIWLHVHIVSNDRANVTIHSRNRSQFFAFVHYLYGVLPEDLVMVAPSEEVPRPAAGDSMTREVNLISSFFTRVLNTEDRKEWAAQNVDEARSMFDTLRQQFKELKPMPGTKGYRNFRKDLYQLENQTDKLVCVQLSKGKS